VKAAHAIIRFDRFPPRVHEITQQAASELRPIPPTDLATTVTPSGPMSVTTDDPVVRNHKPIADGERRIGWRHLTHLHNSHAVKR
jgi:hypothetical protein